MSKPLSEIELEIYIAELEERLRLQTSALDNRSNLIFQLQEHAGDLRTLIGLCKRFPEYDIDVHMEGSSTTVYVSYTGYVFGGQPEVRKSVLHYAGGGSAIERAVFTLVESTTRELDSKRNKEVEFMYGKIREAVKQGIMTVDEIPLHYIPIRDHEWNRRMSELYRYTRGQPHNVGDLKSHPTLIDLIGENEYREIAGRLHSDFGVYIRDLETSRAPKRHVAVISPPFYVLKIS
ncbi:MAG: hypothetical protein HYW23_00010 [Candidatus Aenigmarchaeota archaeon]|nr:hypothetical protein [Candidatus Aenigmarchaeota archaeon]